MNISTYLPGTEVFENVTVAILPVKVPSCMHYISNDANLETNPVGFMYPVMDKKLSWEE